MNINLSFQMADTLITPSFFSLELVGLHNKYEDDVTNCDEGLMTANFSFQQDQKIKKGAF